MSLLRRIGKVLSAVQESVIVSNTSLNVQPSRCLSISALIASTPVTDDSWVPPEPRWWSHQKPAADKYCRQRKILPVGVRVPAIRNDAYVAPSAVVAGDVDIFDGAVIMHGTVIRGDISNVTIGPFTSIHENCVLHAARNIPTGLSPKTTVGVSVTIGAGSLIRSCNIGDLCIIGERCVLMEGSVIKSKAILEPGTVVPPTKELQGGYLYGGNPVRMIRKLTKDEMNDIGAVADDAEKFRDLYQAEELPFGTEWKRAEQVDPTEYRLAPDETSKPNWVKHPADT